MSRATQELIKEAELQTHLEDGWRCRAVLSDGRIVIDRDRPAARRFIDIIRHIVGRSEIEAYLKDAWRLATVQTGVMLPSGRYMEHFSFALSCLSKVDSGSLADQGNGL